MSKSDRPVIYRIVFTQEDDIQEIYAQYISEETLVGFIEADTLLEFDDVKSSLNLKEVRRCYIPLHNIIRIDEVSWHNEEKIKNNISHFPHAFKSKEK